MNLGVYIDILGDNEEFRLAVKTINEGVKNGDLSVASIFYDSASDIPVKAECGLFNSTDLWNFTGTLVTTGMDPTKNALDMVNKFDIIYYYGWNTKNKINTIALLDIAMNPKIKVICRNEQDSKTFSRLTGSKAKVVKDFNLKELLQVAS